MTQSYSIEQAQIVNYTREKVMEFFDTHPVKAHNFDHAQRVAENAVEIAQGEHFADIWLAELAGLLHDIGRVPEHYDRSKEGITHHELSYEMLQQWFHQDKAYEMLSKEQKIMLLYSVRYHWNNAADEYELAWILRDADKLDMFGERGLTRSREFCGEDWAKFQLDLRLRYDSFYWVRTKTAKEIIKEKNLMEPFDEKYLEMLRQKIDPIVL